MLATSLWLTPVWSQMPSSSQSLPSLGDGADITLSAERKLGDRIARELYRDPDFLEDPILDEYLQSIWQPLVKSAQARGELSPELMARFAWKILVGRDRSVNAFALPGGYLGVHLGLIGVVSSRDELASVMAHELSHVTQRHIARSIGEQARMTPWLRRCARSPESLGATGYAIAPPRRRPRRCCAGSATRGYRATPPARGSPRRSCGFRAGSGP